LLQTKLVYIFSEFLEFTLPTKKENKPQSNNDYDDEYGENDYGDDFDNYGDEDHGFKEALK